MPERQHKATEFCFLLLSSYTNVKQQQSVHFIAFYNSIMCIVYICAKLCNSILKISIINLFNSIYFVEISNLWKILSFSQLFPSSHL